jgi:peroxiredoxin
MPVELGSKMPQFTLPDSERKPRNLKDFLGQKVILAYFPGAYTSVCTKEMCTLRDSLHNFDNLGACIIGISVNDPFTLKGFAEKNNLTFPLLSDYNRKTVTRYGIRQKDFAGLKGYVAAKRSVFILDKIGVLRYKWISDDPGKEPDYKAIEQALSLIK